MKAVYSQLLIDIFLLCTIIYLQKKERKPIVWLKSAEKQYLKHYDSSLKLYFKITKENIKIAEDTLNKQRKIKIWHTIEAINSNGIICSKANLLFLINHYSSIS